MRVSTRVATRDATRNARLPALLCVAGLAMAPTAFAALEGSLSAGWRGVSVDGDDGKYRQHVNLDEGARLFDLSLGWRADGPAPDTGLAPDVVELDLSGLGGDPHEYVGLRLERRGRYSLRYDRRSSDYVYEDILAPALAAGPAAPPREDFRSFDFERVREQLALRVRAGPRADLELDVHRQRRRGDARAPLDIEREEFELDAPLDTTDESITAGFRYRWDRATVHLSERIQRLDAANVLRLPEASEGDPAGPTRLDAYRLAQPVDLSAREHRIRIDGRPTRRLRLGVGVLLADVEIDADASERASGLGFTGAPLTPVQSGVAGVDQDRRVLDARFDYALRPDLALFGAARRTGLDQDGRSRFGPSAAVDAGEEAVTSWRIDADRVSAGLSWAPDRRLSLSGGWQVDRRRVRLRDRGQTTEAPRRTEGEGLFLRATARPLPQLALHASVERDRIDDPYTATAATDRNRMRLRGTWSSEGGGWVRIGLEREARENDDSSFDADIDRVDLGVGYSGARLDVSVSASRVRLDREIDVLVLGGIQPTPFAIDFSADTDLVDVQLAWRLNRALRVGGRARVYDSDGQFAAERDDARLFLDGALSDRWAWSLALRRVDFREAGTEDFDARLFEAALRRDL